MKSRKAIVAFLLATLVPGLGYLYNGQIKKALFFHFGLLAYVIIVHLLGVMAHFRGYLAALVILVLLVVFAIIDATLTAYKNREYELKRYNKWYIYLLTIVVFHLTIPVIASITADNSRYRLFEIVTPTGYPNLLVGDFVLADFGAFRHQEPAYGDLLVFSMPNSGNYYIFRLIGLPNDTLHIERQIVTHKNRVSFSELIATVFFEDVEMEIFIQTLPNGFQYAFARIKNPYFDENEEYSEVVVPNNSFFVLGDNRNFADDSRFIGFIEREQIQGRLLAVYFSRDLRRINKRWKVGK